MPAPSRGLHRKPTWSWLLCPVHLSLWQHCLAWPQWPRHPPGCAKCPSVLCAEITLLGCRAGSQLLEPTNPSSCHPSLYLLPGKQDLWEIASFWTLRNYKRTLFLELKLLLPKVVGEVLALCLVYTVLRKTTRLATVRLMWRWGGGEEKQ